MPLSFLESTLLAPLPDDNGWVRGGCMPGPDLGVSLSFSPLSAHSCPLFPLDAVLFGARVVSAQGVVVMQTHEEGTGGHGL